MLGACRHCYRPVEVTKRGKDYRQMGIYYVVADLKKRQYIDPSKIGGGGIKDNAVIYGETANVMAYLMFYEGWEPRYVGDSGELYDEIVGVGDKGFLDVTERTLRKMIGDGKFGLSVHICEDDYEYDKRPLPDWWLEAKKNAAEWEEKRVK